MNRLLLLGVSMFSILITGFAHLFEHLLFMDSDNLGYGGLDEMNTRIGGEGTNGFTTTDMTQYFQSRNAAQAGRLGDLGFGDPVMLE